MKSVIFMGGVADSDEVFSILCHHSFKGKVINIFSTVDEVIKKIFLCTNKSRKPIGLNRISHSSVINIDITDQNIGHMDYERNHHKLLKLIEKQTQWSPKSISLPE